MFQKNMFPGSPWLSRRQ